MINWLLQPLQLLAIVGALIGAFGINNLIQRHVGASRFAEKTEKANTNATALGNSAAAGSADKRVRGRRDPTTRDD